MRNFVEAWRHGGGWLYIHIGTGCTDREPFIQSITVWLCFSLPFFYPQQHFYIHSFILTFIQIYLAIMSLHSLLGLSLLTLASVAQAQDCPIYFDGRIPLGTTPSAFDNANSSLYNPSYNFGASMFAVFFRSIPSNVSSRPYLESDNQNPNWHPRFFGKPFCTPHLSHA